MKQNLFTSGIFANIRYCHTLSFFFTFFLFVFPSLFPFSSLFFLLSYFLSFFLLVIPSRSLSLLLFLHFFLSFSFFSFLVFPSLSSSFSKFLYLFLVKFLFSNSQLLSHRIYDGFCCSFVLYLENKKNG